MFIIFKKKKKGLLKLPCLRYMPPGGIYHATNTTERNDQRYRTESD